VKTGQAPVFNLINVLLIIGIKYPRNNDLESCLIVAHNCEPWGY
jgi:hypothetical protein